MTTTPAPMFIPGLEEPIPALSLGDFAPARAGVILRYGLRGTMAVQWPEALRLVSAGYAVLVPEAPHHGLRADGFLERMALSTAPEARSMFLDLVEGSALETVPLVDHMVRLGTTRFVVAGVSMGGYAALAAPWQDPRVGAVLAFLADPAWDNRPHSPDLQLQAWDHANLLAVVATEDEVVPPGSMRTFIHTLASRSGSESRFTCLEFPGGHTMDPEHWDEAWTRAIQWLDLRTF